MPATEIGVSDCPPDDISMPSSELKTYGPSMMPGVDPATW